MKGMMGLFFLLLSTTVLATQANFLALDEGSNGDDNSLLENLYICQRRDGSRFMTVLKIRNRSESQFLCYKLKDSRKSVNARLKIVGKENATCLVEPNETKAIKFTSGEKRPDEKEKVRIEWIFLSDKPSTEMDLNQLIRDSPVKKHHDMQLHVLSSLTDRQVYSIQASAPNYSWLTLMLAILLFFFIPAVQ